jgi:hypothetical protein
MANLLAHALAAMAFSAFLGAVIGLPAISYGIFVAGLFAMLIELDLDELSPNKRSPITHSIFFGMIWIIVPSLLIYGISILGILSNKNAIMLALAIVSAYTSHLAIDAFTKEGIYTFPKGYNVKIWIKRLSKGDKVCWEYWNLFQSEKLKRWQRANEDPILNALVSIPSLLIIILFVAVMPKPV